MSSHGKGAVGAQWKGERRASAATMFSFAVDPDTGHIYPTDASEDIKPREDAGTLIPSDDTDLTAARAVILGGATGMIY